MEAAIIRPQQPRCDDPTEAGFRLITLIFWTLVNVFSLNHEEHQHGVIRLYGWFHLLLWPSHWPS